MLSDAKGAGSDNIGLKERLHHLLGGRTRITWAEYTNHLKTSLELRLKVGFKTSKLHVSVRRDPMELSVTDLRVIPWSNRCLEGRLSGMARRFGSS